MSERVSITESARILGCDHSLIYYRIENKLLPEPELIGGRKFFKKSIIEKHKEKYPVRKNKK